MISPGALTLMYVRIHGSACIISQGRERGEQRRDPRHGGTAYYCTALGQPSLGRERGGENGERRGETHTLTQKVASPARDRSMTVLYDNKYVIIVPPANQRTSIHVGRTKSHVMSFHLVASQYNLTSLLLFTTVPSNYVGITSR